jgi:sugar phosphate isomerase/epimerase
VASSVAAAVADGFGIATGAYLAERDDWPAALARARREGWRRVELTAIRRERLDALVLALAQDPGLVDGFEHVSVHAPARDFVDDPEPVVAALRTLPYDIVLHPDVYRGQGWVRELVTRAVFENMDAVKAFGKDTADLSETFAAFPEAGFCLDVAHVWTNDPTLALGHELLDAHAGRLRQLHVSGIDPDGTHRPTTPADLELYAPLLARCAGVPWLLEAALAEAAP